MKSPSVIGVKAMLTCKKPHHQTSFLLRQLHRHESARPPSGFQPPTAPAAGGAAVIRRQNGSVRAAIPDIQLDDADVDPEEGSHDEQT